MRTASSAGSQAMHSTRWRFILLAAVAAVWAAHLFLMCSHEIAVQELPDRPSLVSADGVVYQTTNYSCGPASLATLFHYYNVTKSEREWAELAGTGIAHGTSLAGLESAGWGLGFQPIVLNPSFDQLSMIRYPGIVFETREYHLVTFWGMDPDGRMIVRDPVLGKTTMGPDEYKLDTMFDPIVVVFYPGRIPTFGPESSSFEISRCQAMLKSAGYYTADSDGIWSDRLSSAVSQFQADMKIPRTGLVDPPTSLYLEGTSSLVSHGAPSPFMSIDISPSGQRNLSIVTGLHRPD